MVASAPAATLDGGQCPGCDPGYVACNGGCILNGTCCTTPDSCPGDHNTCPSDGGQCPGCDPGYYSCNGTCIPNNKCCTNPDSCPGDNTSCSSNGGDCVCKPGYLDCNHDLSNVPPTNGCEINEKTDNNNCGSCGNKCQSGFTCLGGVCAENAVKCDTTLAYSGSDGTFTYSVTIGTAGPHFTFSYETYSIPDHLIVTDSKGTVLFDKIVGDSYYCSQSGCTSYKGCTGSVPPAGCYCYKSSNTKVPCSCTSCSCPGTSQGDGTGSVQLARAPGVSAVQVKVIGGCGTRWDFRVGCAV
ncbi:hypothetical protein ABPG77_002682 [Micractinium sp. CCAP 211/92]